MELTTPEEFIERHIIDIEIVYVSGSMGWTINNTPEAEFQEDSIDRVITFTIVETGQRISIERSNCVYTSVTFTTRKYSKPRVPPTPTPTE